MRPTRARHPVIETDFLVLGAGVAGLSAAIALGDGAVVLEREDRPGGLVRSERIGDYWFDRVLHLLYFADEATERRVREILGDDLAPCVPEAWVHSLSGRTRFPFQANLNGLPRETIAACLRDLAALDAAGPQDPPPNYETMLISSFGRAMCDEFFLPYNRKMWKRPLDTLSGSGFHWNIARPDYAEVLRGSISNDRPFVPYNARGWYPRPSPEGPRGMEVLSRALANRVADLRLGRDVRRIDLEKRLVVAEAGGREETLHYGRALVSTLPLPVLLRIAKGVPDTLRESASRLRWNRVLTPCFCVRGPRPEHVGHWRYFADPETSFTRLVFMHSFDSASAPAYGWGLMAEITEPAEWPLRSAASVLERTRRDVERLGILPSGSEFVGESLIVNDSGYVVFEHGVRKIVSEVEAFLRGAGVEPLGRYGRWEYSSMAQVMRDGFTLGDRLRAARDGETPRRVSRTLA